MRKSPEAAALLCSSLTAVFFFFYPSELYLQGGEGGRGVVEGEAEKSQKKEEPLGRNIGS